jgi:hypothetical protein
MADISVEKKSSGDFTWIWAVAAIAAVLGLMFWLFTSQDEARVAGPVEREPVAAAAVDTVDLAAVNADPDAYYGNEIFVDDAEIASVLGSGAFWVNVEGQNPFLVIVGADIADTGWLSTGATVDLTGVVEPITDADLDRWVQTGALHPDARTQAAFVGHYLRATAASAG